MGGVHVDYRFVEIYRGTRGPLCPRVLLCLPPTLRLCQLNTAIHQNLDSNAVSNSMQS